MDRGNWNNLLLQQEFTNVFNSNCLNQELPEKQIPQLLQAFNKITTFGKSREEFDKNLGLNVPLGEEEPRRIKHPYSNLKSTELDLIFRLFSACSDASPEYRSNNEKKPRKRRKNEREGFLPHRTILSTAARWSRVSVMTVECWMPWKRICRGCSMSCPF